MYGSFKTNIKIKEIELKYPSHSTERLAILFYSLTNEGKFQQVP